MTYPPQSVIRRFKEPTFLFQHTLSGPCLPREAGGGYLALTRVQESLEELEDVYDDWDDDPKARQPSMDDMLNDLIGDLGLYILMCWFETM